METICQQAHRLLKDIPADQFIINRFSDEESKCCVVGHFVRLTSENPADYSENNCCDWGRPASKLRLTTRDFIKERVTWRDRDITDVNNTTTINGWTDPDIKTRVINFLEDAIKAGY